MSNELELEKWLEGIQEHSLEAENVEADHDTIIAIQAQKLMEIGYLEYEAADYATAYYKDGEIHYYICENETMMDNFLRNCLERDIITIPVKYYYKRYDLLKDTADAIDFRFRYEVAEKMHQAYPKILFEAVSDLTETPSTNNAYPILKEMSAQLTSCFDTNHLQLFDALLQMLRQRRHLSVEGYTLLRGWLDNEYEKMTVEPISSGIYSRIYAGFAYQKPHGEVEYFFDAYPYMTKEKQIKYLTKGYVVTPILKKTYYGSSFDGINAEKDNFKKDMHKYLFNVYIPLMKLLRKLPPSVDSEKYHLYAKKIMESGSKQAIEAYSYYGILWNVNERV